MYARTYRVVHYVHQLSALPDFQLYWNSGFTNWESNAGVLCHNFSGCYDILSASINTIALVDFGTCSHSYCTFV